MSGSFTGVPVVLATVGSVVPPGPIPPTNPGDVFVDGNASLSADTTVVGDLVVNGVLTNTGGYNLTVGGKLACQSFNFSAASSSAPQGNVTVGGDFFFAANSTFNVANRTQFPTLTVGGDLDGSGSTLDGSGGAEASGLGVTVNGNVSSVNFNLNGGAGAGSHNAGPSGFLVVNGDAVNTSFTINGGDNGFAGHGSGACNGVLVQGNLILRANSSANSGDVTVGNGNAGNTSPIQVGGDLCSTSSTVTLSANGGSTSGSGAGATASGIMVGGSIVNVTLSSVGGNSTSGTSGDGGPITAAGSIINAGVITTAGGTTGTPGADSYVTASGDLEATSATAIQGNFYGDVYLIQGPLSISGNTSITGDFFCGTSTVRNAGGFSLAIGGSAFMHAMNFTPTNGATSQSNVTINGDLRILANSEFRPNKGQSPHLTIGGNFEAAGFAGGPSVTFNGSGQLEATGLTVTLSGDTNSITFQLNGGDSNNVANAGAGGVLNIGGSAQTCDVFCVGGASAHTGFAAGAGGQVFASAWNAGLSGIWVNGGSCSVSTATTGGAGGTVYINGPFVGYSGGGDILAAGGTGGSGNGGAGGSVSLSGSMSHGTLDISGGGSTSGNGGAAGSFGFQNTGTDCELQDVTLVGHGGASTNANGGNGAATVTLNGDCSLVSVNFAGGAGNAGSGTGGNGGALTINGSCTLTTPGSTSFAGGAGHVAGTAGSFTVTSGFSIHGTALSIGVTPTVSGYPVLTGFTGAGSAALGANSPAGTLTAPYAWLKMIHTDGSTVYVPAWK